MKKSVVAILVLAATTAPAFAETDIAFQIDELNHDKQSGWIFDRLMTLELGKTCAAKVADKKNAAVAKLAADTRYIARYAKEITEDDWQHVESQSVGDRDKNRDLVDKMVDEFKGKFHITVKIEGDDCDVNGNVLWLNYVSNTISAIVKYPPKSKQMTVQINVVAKAKDVKAEINKAGTTLTVTGPRDIEPVGWSSTIETAMKHISPKG